MLIKKLLFIFFILYAFGGISQEICDNGLDDDFDGLIDLQDTAECLCEAATGVINDTIPSIIPNPSFENMDCCPSALSQLSCASQWQQASGGTTDYFNTCGGFLKNPGAGHNLPPTPLPDGNGYVGLYNGFTGGLYGNLKEYAGSCLTTPFVAGTEYRMQFQAAISQGNNTMTFCIYGTNNCANIPFGDGTEVFGCPSNDPNWTQIACVTVNIPTGSWTTVNLDFIPSANYPAMALGPDCINANSKNYYYIDNLILNKKDSFNFSPPLSIQLESGHYCQGNAVLKATFDSIPDSFQWYKDSIAIIGANDSTYSIPAGETGAYTLRILYDTICSLSNTITIIPTNLTIQYDSLPSCETGNNIGEITVLGVSGGTTPYQYQLNSNGYGLSNTFTNLAPGQYWIFVKDSNQCIDSVQVNIDTIYNPIANIMVDSVCLTHQNIFASLQFNTAHTYLWKFGDGNTNNLTQTSVNHTYASSGSYQVSLLITDANGCSDSTQETALVYANPKVDFNYSKACENDNVSFTNASIFNGGLAGFSWLWDFGNGNTAISQNGNTTYTSNGNYNVHLTGTSPQGCSHDTIKQILIYPKPIPNFSADSVCFNLLTHILDGSTIATGSIISWQYNTDGLYFDVPNPTHIFSTSGFIPTTLIVGSNEGCLDSITKNIRVYPLPTADFNYAPSTINTFNTNICFSNLSVGASSYNWNYGFPGASSNDFERCVIFPYVNAGNYTVQLISITDQGCVDTALQEITIVEGQNIYVPNTFTPNGDGFNDVFTPVVLGIEDYEFLIFDRWGELLFKTNILNEGWDGSYKGYKAKTDTYVYVVTYRGNEATTHKKIGHVNLIR